MQSDVWYDMHLTFRSQDIQIEGRKMMFRWFWSQVDKLRENLLEVLGVQAKLSARAEALESLKTRYISCLIRARRSAWF